MVKACIVDALQTVYNSAFLPEGVRGIPVSIEYPMTEQEYPSIWVNYDDNDQLSIVGIDYKEYVWDYPDPHNPLQPDPNHTGPNPMHEVTRWRFAGEITLTFVALTSLERDNLYDQFVRVFAFSRQERAGIDFRDIIESNDFVGMFVNWDELRPHGDAASPGTPWGTEDEVVYEKSIGFDVQGEFISDPGTNTIARLSSIIVTGYRDGPDNDDNPYVLGLPRDDD